MLKADSTHSKKLNRQEVVIAIIIEKAREAKARMEQWEVPGVDDEQSWDCLLSGLKKAYARGRKEMKRLNADSGDEAFHDWRKKIKDLGYYFKLLKPAWPRIMKATAQELGELGDILGDKQDLWVLQTYLYEQVPGSNAKMMKLLGELVPYLDKQRQSLMNDAVNIGSRLFAETPKAFEQRLADYMYAWRDEVAAC